MRVNCLWHSNSYWFDLRTTLKLLFLKKNIIKLSNATKMHSDYKRFKLKFVNPMTVDLTIL